MEKITFKHKDILTSYWDSDIDRNKAVFGVDNSFKFIELLSKNEGAFISENGVIEIVDILKGSRVIADVRFLIINDQEELVNDVKRLCFEGLGVHKIIYQLIAHQSFIESVYDYMPSHIVKEIEEQSQVKEQAVPEEAIPEPVIAVSEEPKKVKKERVRVQKKNKELVTT